MELRELCDLAPRYFIPRWQELDRSITNLDITSNVTNTWRIMIWLRLILSKYQLIEAVDMSDRSQYHTSLLQTAIMSLCSILYPGGIFYYPVSEPFEVRSEAAVG